MKFLLLAVVTIFAFSAEASYYATHCSNARGTVKWETGHNSNTITFKYADTEEREKAISVGEVAITTLGETTITESTTRCNYDHKRTYAAQVKIEAALEAPGALDFLGLELPLKESVICEYHVSSRGRCP